jgi:hypothetical protein
MFAGCVPEKVERLLDQPVGHFGILAQVAGERLFPCTQGAAFPEDEQTRGDSRFAPRPIYSLCNLFHLERLTELAGFCNPTRQAGSRQVYFPSRWNRCIRR